MDDNSQKPKELITFNISRIIKFTTTYLIMCWA